LVVPVIVMVQLAPTGHSQSTHNGLCKFLCKMANQNPLNPV